MEQKKTVTFYLAAQQGGTSSEWYVNAYGSEQDALKDIGRWKQASYRGVGPVAVKLDAEIDRQLDESGGFGELLGAMADMMGKACQLQRASLVG